MPTPFVLKTSSEERIFEVDLTPVLRPNDTISGLDTSQSSSGSQFHLSPDDDTNNLETDQEGIDTDSNVLLFRAKRGVNGRVYTVTVRFMTEPIAASGSTPEQPAQTLETCFEVRINDAC